MIRLWGTAVCMRLPWHWTHCEPTAPQLLFVSVCNVWLHEAFHHSCYQYWKLMIAPLMDDVITLYLQMSVAALAAGRKCFKLMHSAVAARSALRLHGLPVSWSCSQVSHFQMFINKSICLEIQEIHSHQCLRAEPRLLIPQFFTETVVFWRFYTHTHTQKWTLSTYWNKILSAT